MHVGEAAEPSRNVGVVLHALEVVIIGNLFAVSGQIYEKSSRPPTLGSKAGCPGCRI
jgi:hypothetical protein